MLSSEQIRALAVIRERCGLTQVRGPAGTGKSTLAVALANEPGAAALTLTGKAAAVLKREGARRVSTIHSYLYGSPKVTIMADGREELRWQLRDQPEQFETLVIDEVSQIDAVLGRHLLARGAKIVTFGDSIQLPPIDGGQAFFDPFPVDAELTQIHRQAALSPVLRLATQIREGDRLPSGEPLDPEELARADIVLCALNETRSRLNVHIRRRRFGVRRKDSPPVVGERVIALRNDYGADIWNGTLWRVEQVTQRGDLLVMELFDEDEGHRSVSAPLQCFTDPKAINIHRLPRNLTPLNFGYALTTHKSQGSQWQHVAVINETRDDRFRRMAGKMLVAEFRRRWLYVAVSRAVKRITLVDFGG